MRHYVILAKESNLLTGTWLQEHWYSPDVDEKITWHPACLNLTRCREWLTGSGYTKITRQESLGDPPAWTLDELFTLDCYSILRLTYDPAGQFQTILYFSRNNIPPSHEGSSPHGENRD